MFGYLEGEVFNLRPTKAIITVGGIGFVVNSTINCLEKIKVGTKAKFWIHTAVRESSIDLYGFETEDELRVFELLLTISGVGPKSALTIIGVAGINAIEEAVAGGDTGALTKISGIGKKTAERIVVELNGKLVARNETKTATKNTDVYDALLSLGYREREIQDAIRSLPKEIEGTNERIKYVLKNLGK